MRPANTLSWTLYLLARHPEIQDSLAAEVRQVLAGRLPEGSGLQALPYTQMVLMEAQRLYPPAWIIRRKALKPVEIMGYQLPAGTNMMVSQWVIHRDARYYPGWRAPRA